jgi:hypothetical protein
MRELDGRRREHPMRELYREDSRLLFVASLGGSKQLGPRRSTLVLAAPET